MVMTLKYTAPNTMMATPIVSATPTVILAASMAGRPHSSIRSAKMLRAHGRHDPEELCQRTCQTVQLCNGRQCAAHEAQHF